MKLRNRLPTKFLTEENPFISLSFEVGYRRLAVVVGETIVFTMANMIRADIDSQVFLCPPAHLFGRKMEGGLYRSDRGAVQAASTPAHRSMFYQETGLKRYGEFVDYIGLVGGLHGASDRFTEHLLNLRRTHKANNRIPTREDMERIRRTMNDPWTIYRKSSSMGSSFMTQQMFEKQLREGRREAGFEEMDYTVRKLLNNGYSGMGHPGSAHTSLTALCRPSRNYRLTSQPGGCGVLTRLVEYAADQTSRKAEANLAKKYYFTGEGMLPKDL